MKKVLRFIIVTITLIQLGSIFSMEPKKGGGPRGGRPGVKYKRKQPLQSTRRAELPLIQQPPQARPQQIMHPVISPVRANQFRPAVQPLEEREVVRAQPAAQPTREIVRVQPIAPQRPVLQRVKTEECPICLNVQTGNKAPCCGQAICPACWEKWHQQHHTCPFCRAGEDANEDADAVSLRSLALDKYAKEKERFLTQTQKPVQKEVKEVKKTGKKAAKEADKVTKNKSGKAKSKSKK